MAKVCHEAVVPYTCKQMYALVSDVNTYSEFLPWCESSVVQKEYTDGSVLATLGVASKGIRTQFTTHNEGTPCEALSMRLSEGPFKQLYGVWKFISLGDSSCRVVLDFEYVLSNTFYEKLLSSVFDHIVNSLMDAFLKEAESRYGDTL